MKIGNLILKVENRLRLFKVKLLRYVPFKIYSMFGLGDMLSKDVLIDKLESFIGNTINNVVLETRDADIIISHANQVLNHEFDILGSGFVRVEPIKWNVEFKTGFHWSNSQYYQDIRNTTPLGSDIKFPWELSRCHHLLWVGEAYQITKDEKYAKEVVDELNDWIDNNPLMYTVNWTCAMEVAIRAVNWIYALTFIKDSQYFDDTIAKKIYQSLYQHGFFIYNNLERTIPYSNNHYISDVIGLLYLGKLFHNTRRGRRWFSYAKKAYYKEVMIQVLPSGVNYEKSVSYHRLMTELLVYPYYMLVRTEEQVPIEIKERLSMMIVYVLSYTKPNGKSPMIADNDNGRFLPFIPREFQCHAYLTKENSLESKIVSIGCDSIIPKVKALSSQFYQDANVSILRKDDQYLFISSSSRWKFDTNTSRYVGTHLHNDLLSFVYSYGECDLIVDAGAYCYTSNLKCRNEFRSTKKHNTVMIDGEEQNLLAYDNAFGMKYNSDVKSLSYSNNHDTEICEGSYTTIAEKTNHNRRFELTGLELTIIDHISKEGSNHNAYASFHFDEKVTVRPVEGGFQLEADGYIFKMSVTGPEGLECKIIDDTISPSYGVLKKSKTLAINWIFDSKSEIITKVEKL